VIMMQLHSYFISSQQFQFIRVDIISTSLSTPENSICIYDVDYSQYSSTLSLSTTPPPSYEVALTDPPPPLPPCDC
ncbi:2416_t:CDS:1, partial [Paraglomus brasilianum]